MSVWTEIVIGTGELGTVIYRSDGSLPPAEEGIELIPGEYPNDQYFWDGEAVQPLPPPVDDDEESEESEE